MVQIPKDVEDKVMCAAIKAEQIVRTLGPKVSEMFALIQEAHGLLKSANDEYTKWVTSIAKTEET